MNKFLFKDIFSTEIQFMHNVVIKFSFLLVFFVLSTNQVYAQDSDGDGIANLLDLDDDNDGILDINDGCTDPDNMPLSGGSSSIPNATSGTLTYNQSSVASLTFNMTASTTFFTGPGSSFTFTEGGNTTKNIDMVAAGNGSLYLTAIKLDSFLWDGSGRNRIGFLRLTLADGTVITNPTTTIVKTYNGETLGLDNIAETLISGNRFYGDVDGDGVQAAGFVVLTTTVVNQIRSGGGVRRIQFQQVTTRSAYANAGMSFIGTYSACRDLDGDGLTDNLDLDSDNDGCLDAIEGDENVSTGQLVNASGTVTVGTGSSAANQNLGTTIDANGVPIIVNSGGSADIGGDLGQGVGQAAIANPAVVGGTASSNQTIVYGATPTALNLSGHSGTIQWQSSPDNVTFTNISGATSTAYAPGALTANTYYRAVLTSAGGCTAFLVP